MTESGELRGSGREKGRGNGGSGKKKVRSEGDREERMEREEMIYKNFILKILNFYCEL